MTKQLQQWDMDKYWHVIACGSLGHIGVSCATLEDEQRAWRFISTDLRRCISQDISSDFLFLISVLFESEAILSRSSRISLTDKYLPATTKTTELTNYRILRTQML